jgi:hypothetical protein
MKTEPVTPREQYDGVNYRSIFTSPRTQKALQEVGANKDTAFSLQFVRKTTRKGSHALDRRRLFRSKAKEQKSGAKKKSWLKKKRKSTQQRRRSSSADVPELDLSRKRLFEYKFSPAKNIAASFVFKKVSDQEIEIVSISVFGKHETGCFELIQKI